MFYIARHKWDNRNNMDVELICVEMLWLRIGTNYILF
jgi:hypothetical protein